VIEALQVARLFCEHRTGDSETAHRNATTRCTPRSNGLTAIARRSSSDEEKTTLTYARAARDCAAGRRRRHGSPCCTAPFHQSRAPPISDLRLRCNGLAIPPDRAVARNKHGKRTTLRAAMQLRASRNTDRSANCSQLFGINRSPLFYCR